MTDFLNRSKFSKKVEETVMDKRIPYMEAVLLICEEHTIDPADVNKFLSKVIKEKIEAEAKRLNFLPKGNELPV